MPVTDLVTLAVLLGLCALIAPFLGRYIADVLEGRPHPLARVLGPVERAIYRVAGIDPGRERGWRAYAGSLLVFSLVSILVLYLQQRLQAVMPLNPTSAPAVPEDLALNTAVSFVTNTNWQNYSGEVAMAHLTQTAGLAVQNFLSAAAGMAIAVALIRGITAGPRPRSATSGPTSRARPCTSFCRSRSSQRSCSSGRVPRRPSRVRRP
jgi:K+-transporting ATPase ATPase A chain